MSGSTYQREQKNGGNKFVYTAAGLVTALYSIPYKVNKHKDDLINYIMFLRMTPFLPNWFINIVSPVIGVPVFPFFTATVIGTGSYQYIQS